MTAHALLSGGQAYEIWAELTRCNRYSIRARRVEIGVTAQYYSCVELPQRETGMGDNPVKKVTRNPLSMEIDHLQDLSLDIVDTGWKLVEPDVVAMNLMTAKDDYPNDVEHH